MDIYEKLLSNLDKKSNTCAIFLDLAKAFDSVSHKILIQKLQKYGIHGKLLDLFVSYLSSRSQFVKFDNTQSSLINILFGVPQGSILGPLLFLIFINDLPNAFKFFIRLFADDTFLCAQNDDFLALENEVNIELKKVYIWLVSNKLTLNIKKSQFMLLTNKKNIPKFTVKINDEELESCDSYKYLGVYIDKSLSWKCHIDYICTKISKACGALSKIRHIVDIETLCTVYYALANSYLRYGILAWGNATDSIIKPLDTLINRCVRIMSFAPFGHIQISPIYECLDILNVENTFNLETAKFIFKSINGLLPLSSIASHFELEAPIMHNYNTRQRNSRSNIIDFSSSYGKKSIQFRKTQALNAIPAEIRNLRSLNAFKKHYKKYLNTLTETN